MIEDTSLQPRLRRPRSRLQLLVRISEALASDADAETLITAILEMIGEALDAAGVALWVPEQRHGGDEMRIAYVGRGTGLETAMLDVELGLREEVLRTGIAVKVDDVRSEPRYHGTVERQLGLDPRTLLAAPLQARGKVVGLLVVIREETVPFADADLRLLQAVGDRLAAWVENDALMRRLRSELEQREMLLSVARAVGETLDLDQMLARMFEVLSPVVAFDAAAIFLFTPETGRLKLAAQRGYTDHEAIAEMSETDGLIGLVTRQNRAVLIDQVSEHPDYYKARAATQSEMAVPIVSGGQIVGVINLESDTPGFYGERDLHTAQLIATQVASAIINARLYRSTLRQTQVQHELDLAREIQLSLLPQDEPGTDRLDVYAVNVPSSTVGGDYYDYVRCSADTLSLALADVSGHGLSAALLTASMRTGFRLLARDLADPAAMASRLSQVLFAGSPANQYVAGVLCKLHLATGLLTYTNAGHEPPFVLSASGVREMTGGGVPLGLFPDSPYTTHEMPLETGDLIVFYTDGISECESQAGEPFGRERLLEALTEARKESPRDVVRAVRARVRAHRGRRGRHIDDVTLMVARWKGPSAPAT